MTAGPAIPASSPRSPELLFRLLLAAVGVGFGAWGAWKLLPTLTGPQLWPVLRWGVGGIIVHDALLAPLGVVIGLLTFSLVRGPARPWLRAALLGVASVVLIVVVTAGARTGRQNPTVLPTSPWLALLVGLAAVAVALLLAGLGRRLLRRRTA